MPQTFSHRMLAQVPIKVAGGQVRITDSSNFPVATTIAAALIAIEPGGMRDDALDTWIRAMTVVDHPFQQQRP